VRSHAVSTVKKSTARIARAWARRNSLHEGPVLRGAGGRPARLRIVRMVVAPIQTPKLSQLAPDADAFPPGVLPTEADDQIPDAGIERRAAESLPPSIGPLPPHQLAVPAKEGLRRDQEGGPPLPRQQPAGRREEDSIDPSEAKPSRLPPS
jgi:hypothetical protein